MNLDSEWMNSIGIPLFLSKFFWPNGVLRRFTLTPFPLFRLTPEQMGRRICIDPLLT